MKAKIIRGAGFGGCSRYILQEGKGADIIGGNLTGQTAQAIAEEFRRVANQRPDIEKPVWHSPLSAAPGERYSDEKWNVIADEYLQGLGFNLDKTAYIVVRHKDKPHDHVHIESSRVMLDGTLYLGKNENLKATKLTQLLEIKHGLIRTKGPTYDVAGKIVMPDTSKLTSGEQEMIKRGEIPPRVKLQNIIKANLKNRPTQEEFERRVREAGVTFKRSSGGYSFRIGEIAFKGSNLGKLYSYNNIRKSFITPEEVQQRETYAARAVAWKAENTRRSRFRANRSITISVAHLAANLLPHPLGEAVQLAAETLIIIGKINDWTQAQSYKKQVDRLRTQLHQSKVDRLATEKAKAVKPVVTSPTQSEALPPLEKNKTTFQQPVTESAVKAATVEPSPAQLNITRLAEIDKAIVRLDWQFDNDRISQAAHNEATDRLEAEMQRIINAVPGTKITLDYGTSQPIKINGDSVQTIMQRHPTLPLARQHLPTASKIQGMKR